MLLVRHVTLFFLTCLAVAAETKVVVRKAGANAAFEVPQITVPAGERVIFSTPIVSGDVWLKDGKPLYNGFGPTYVIESASPRDSGKYRVNFISDEVTDSQEVQLSVLAVEEGAGAKLDTFSARGFAGPGARSLVFGFIISESPSQPTATKRVLVRAVGPSLADYGVADCLADPKLTVFGTDGKQVFPTPVDRTDLAQAHLKTGAFPLRDNAGDIVQMFTLPAGGYTAQLTTATENNGLVLFDIHEVPPDK